MGTPQKSVGRLLESPYARHVQQYPSQSEEFIPNEFGGKNWVSSSTPFKQQHQGNNYHKNLIDRRRGNNRYLNTNRGETNYCGNTKGSWGNRNCQNNCNPQQTQRNSNISNRLLPFHGQEINQSECSFTNNYQYYHPSMLDDPWKELIDRHQAIKSSYIDAQSLAITEEQQYEPSHDEKPS